MYLKEIKRFFNIIKVFLKYGLDEFIDKKKFIFFYRIRRYLFFWIRFKKKFHKKSIEERLRLAIEELGPIWIKFGQMLSTRKDFFSSKIFNQLEYLQNRVFSSKKRNIRYYIKKSLGYSVDSFLKKLDDVPFASASIAEIYSAILKKNNQNVIIKIIRPNIDQIIKLDIKLMYRIVKIIEFFLKKNFFIMNKFIKEYEKILSNELDLLKEAANTIQLRRNFKNSSILYIPKIYLEHCRENILVAERIYGTPISNIDKLKKMGMNMKILAERGLKIFFMQVFRDGFFHADMHPGNIFVNKNNLDNPTYIGIDCGIIGFLNSEDRRYLAENFIAFFNRDYSKIAELNLSSGMISKDVNLKEFESSIRFFCEPIFSKPISEISFSNILLHLFKTAYQFNIEVHPQFILLQKTLFYVEGLGKEIYPKLNLWKVGKPFLEKWLRREIGIFSVVNSIRNKFPYWLEKIPEIPDLIFLNLKKNKHHDLVKFNKVFLKKLTTLFIQCFYLFFLWTFFLFSLILFFIFYKKSVFLKVILSGILIFLFLIFRKIKNSVKNILNL